MILGVQGQLEFFICTECKDRWVGQSGEPETQKWLDGHSKPHTKLGSIITPPSGTPRGFGRDGL